MLRLRFLLSTAKTSTISYYDVLGIKQTASPAEVKLSFYKLIKQHHPDHSQNQSPEAMKRFHQLREAFEVLSDVQRRRLYDSSAEFKTTERPNRSNSKKYTARNEKHEESDAFDEEDKYFRRSYWSMRRPTQGEDVYESIKINLLESVKGVTKKLRFTRKCVCMDCQRAKLQKCFTCGGRGKLHLKKQKGETSCYSCNGAGFLNHCNRCQGDGFVMELLEEDIDVPKGTPSQTVLRKEKAGHQGFKSKNGDLYVKVEVQQHPQFAVEGNNIRTVKLVPISTAALGGKTEVNTVYGPVEVSVTPGTQSGDEKRLTNLGLASMFSKQMGDHIVTFKIRVPKPTEIKNRALYEALQASEVK